jgi:hypothetical protein
MRLQGSQSCLLLMAEVGVVAVPAKFVLVEGGMKGRRVRGEWVRGRTSNLVFSAIILWNPIPTPSITASKHAHPIAEFRAAFAPPLIASAPPVKNPAMTIAFCQSGSIASNLSNISSVARLEMSSRRTTY